MVRKKIMLVEDNPINRAMLREILSSEYDLLEAENGQVALELLREHSEELALILLDVIMPVMDGYTFLSVIKETPAYAPIPVIVTTQSDGEADEVAALSLGASDFVAKPYRPKIILHRVASIINLRETSAMINSIRYDRLTGAYSKEFFYQQVRQTMLQHPDRQYDIICSDIENFKLVNDIFGVPTGDLLLRSTAKVFQDQIGDAGFCGRVNADKFAVLMWEKRTYSNELFAGLCARIGGLANVRNVVMKWGVYEVEDRRVSVEQMCDRALLAAQGIKGQYGKYFAVYDDQLRNRMLRERDITDGMETALREGQFLVYMQPKYRVKDDGLSGAEALVRWKHPRWGMQSPGEFVPLFEKNGFITRLDQFVWDRSCAALREWDDKGYQPIPVSVNVSRADIYNADIADILLKTVRKYSLSPSRLHLEITESAYTENPSQLLDTVSYLRQLGVVIEMDDFGSGYSSLNMLNKMPIDILKLDMKFIQSETAKPVNRGILRFIMDLASWMDLSVVAEGVETREQLDRLREVGCDYVQGYYFARPMALEDFEELLRSQNAPREEDYEDWGELRLERNTKLLLVVDEDACYRVQVRKTFEGEFQILEADSNTAAMKMLAHYQHTVAGIILSMTLPTQGDQPVLQTLQREKQMWDIPVVVTGPPDEQMEEQALEQGADDYAAKPHSQKSLWRRTLRAMGITAARERERLLRSEAYQDYLTGVFNRRGLMTSVSFLKERDAPAAVYLFDLDNLKKVNDTFGHSEGDKLLKQFGMLLRAHTRETDILARLGGDEFVVVLKQIGSEEIAQRKGEEICQAFAAAWGKEGINGSCSAGVALWDGAEQMKRIIRQADQALYQAKQSNKGSVCIWKEQAACGEVPDGAV